MLGRMLHQSTRGIATAWRTSLAAPAASASPAAAAATLPCTAGGVTAGTRGAGGWARRHASTFAVVFDIDGVLYRGKQDIEPAARVLRSLAKRNIPHIFMTNGGGLTESEKADRLAARLGEGVDVSAQQMFLSHTPMRELDEYKDKLVLAVGKDQAKTILER